MDVHTVCLYYLHGPSCALRICYQCHMTPYPHPANQKPPDIRQNSLYQFFSLWHNSDSKFKFCQHLGTRLPSPRMPWLCHDDTDWRSSKTSHGQDAKSYLFIDLWHRQLIAFKASRRHSFLQSCDTLASSENMALSEGKLNENLDEEATIQISSRGKSVLWQSDWGGRRLRWFGDAISSKASLFSLGCRE